MTIKILVIDDSPTIRQHVIHALGETGSYSFVEATDGNEGIREMLKDLKIGLAICDINMPGCDGLTMLEKKIIDPKIKDIPILMLTTEGSMEMIQKAKKSGANAWMVKPFKTNRLRDIVYKLTSGSSLEDEVNNEPEKLGSILVIDDEPDLRELVTYCIHLVTRDYHIDYAEDGLDGYSKALTKNYSVIVTDLKMPKASGTQLYNQLLNIEEVPIVIVSGYLGDLDSSDLRKNVHLVAKPFGTKALAALFENILDIRKAS